MFSMYEDPPSMTQIPFGFRRRIIEDIHWPKYHGKMQCKCGVKFMAHGDSPLCDGCLTKEDNRQKLLARFRNIS
jgi:hypothetical protein